MGKGVIQQDCVSCDESRQVGVSSKNILCRVKRVVG